MRSPLHAAQLMRNRRPAVRAMLRRPAVRAMLRWLVEPVTRSPRPVAQATPLQPAELATKSRPHVAQTTSRHGKTKRVGALWLEQAKGLLSFKV